MKKTKLIEEAGIKVEINLKEYVDYYHGESINKFILSLMEEGYGEISFQKYYELMRKYETETVQNELSDSAFEKLVIKNQKYVKEANKLIAEWFVVMLNMLFDPD